MVEHNSCCSGQQNLPCAKDKPRPGLVACRRCFRKGDVIGGDAVSVGIGVEIAFLIPRIERVGDAWRKNNQEQGSCIDQDKMSEGFLYKVPPRRDGRLIISGKNPRRVREADEFYPNLALTT